MEKKYILNNLDLLQDTLNYHFKDEALLTQALTHPSFAYESKEGDSSSNQRLEFLGDSILGMVAAEYLYKKFPTVSEGELTNLRSLLVNRNNLTKKAVEMDLARYLFLGRGEEKTGGRDNPSNLANSLEAIIGAIYLDGSFEEVRNFIIQKIV